jgi:magnesium-transporting ATPase (P-type)
MSTTTNAGTDRAPYHLDIEEVAASLETDARRGLPTAEARERLVRYGRNELTEEEAIPAWKKSSVSS